MKDWKKYRREDGSINIIEVWCDEQWPPLEYKEKVIIEFLQQIEEYQLIKSRQVAAMILAQADFNLSLI